MHIQIGDRYFWVGREADLWVLCWRSAAIQHELAA